jgi:integrase
MSNIHQSKFKSLSEPGRHSDGNGLYLSIGKSGARSWLFQYRSREKGRRIVDALGNRREHAGNRVVQLGLGPAEGNGKPGLSLSQARHKAKAMRDLIDEGGDPLKQKREHQSEVEKVNANLFGPFADAFYERISPQFKNQKHKDQWKTTVEIHCASLRPKPIAEVDIDMVRNLLAPLWKTTPETASRIRGRIERIFNAAIAEGFRKDNPASLAIHQAILGVPIAKLKASKHFAALPYKQMPAFMSKLRKLDSVSALALEYLILTVTRTGETIGGAWPEIDTDEKVWAVPGDRMKAGREHIVPLVPRALAILKRVAPLRDKDSNYIFPGEDGGPLSNMALLECVRGLHPGVTVHGFRSTFTDWAHDTTDFADDVIEASLAHTIKNKTKAAYRRATAIAKRRELLAAWQTYLGRA